MNEPLPPKYVRAVSGPLELEFLGHRSLEEYDKEAGYPGACLDYADRWHIHRDTINVFDEAFTPWVEKLTSIPRDTDKRLTERRRSFSPNPSKITPIRERFLTYINRVFAKVSPELQRQIKAEALRQSRLLAVNVAPAERTAPIEIMFYKRADSILEADLDTINLKVSKFLSLVPNFEVARDANDRPLRDSLARLLQRYEQTRYAQED